MRYLGLLAVLVIGATCGVTDEPHTVFIDEVEYVVGCLPELTPDVLGQPLGVREHPDDFQLPADGRAIEGFPPDEIVALRFGGRFGKGLCDHGRSSWAPAARRYLDPERVRELLVSLERCCMREPLPRMLVEVPDLVGGRKRDAIDFIRENPRLGIKILQEPSDEPKGTILAQDPPPGGGLDPADTYADELVITVARPRGG